MNTKLLTARELAKTLGFKTNTIRVWTIREGLPCVRFGRHVRYDLHAVIEWGEKRAAAREQREAEEKHRQATRTLPGTLH